MGTGHPIRLHQTGSLLRLEEITDYVKKKSFTYSEKGPIKRYLYLLAFMAYIICFDVDNVVYVDESGVDEYYERDLGRAMIGVRVEDTKRGKRSRRTNVVAGLLGKKHIAVRTYNHATTAVFFEDWFEWELLAALRENALVIMDNASFHRKNRLYDIATRYGVHILFLPPYSPDYNAIEPSWANLKRWLRDNRNRFPNCNMAIESYFGIY